MLLSQWHWRARRITRSRGVQQLDAEECSIHMPRNAACLMPHERHKQHVLCRAVVTPSLVSARNSSLETTRISQVLPSLCRCKASARLNKSVVSCKDHTLACCVQAPSQTRMGCYKSMWFPRHSRAFQHVFVRLLLYSKLPISCLCLSFDGPCVFIIHRMTLLDFHSLTLFPLYLGFQLSCSTWWDNIRFESRSTQTLISITTLLHVV